MNKTISSLVIASSIGLAALVSGCQTQYADWHQKDGTPVKGLVPYSLSGQEAHHGYAQDEAPQGILSFVDYSF